MECIVLGAGGMMPMPQRLTTSVLLRREGRMIMFDAGEGIQIALKRGGLGIRALDAVAISHLHADHILGLPGILMFRAQCEDPGPLTILGPPGTERFVRHTLEDLRYHLNFTIDFVEWSEKAGDFAWSWNGHSLTWHLLEHSTLCLGYRLQEASRPGKFDPERATALGVPPGPVFGRLQSGETVTLESGATVKPDDVMGESRRGRIVTYATDTRPCDGLIESCRDADLAFVEGMFALEHEQEAAQKMHMTSSQAAMAARTAGARRLVLVHISPRYTYEAEETLRSEASEHFENVEIGRGLASYEVPLPD